MTNPAAIKSLSLQHVQASDVLWFAGPEIGSVPIDGGLVLFSLESRRLHRLNETAAQIWEAVAPGRSIGEVIALLASTYGVSPAVVADDVRETIDQLREDSLLLDTVSSEAALTPDDLQLVLDQPPTVVSKDTRRIGTYRAIDSTITVDLDPSGDPAGAEMFAAAAFEALSPLVSNPQAASEPAGTAVRYVVRAGDEHDWELDRDGTTIGGSMSAAGVLRLLLGDINGSALASVDDAVVFHAGSVELAHGVVMAPGVSNAGKSTLIAQLVARGHGYLTDEATSVGLADQHVRPFHKALCIDPGSQELLNHLEPTHPISAIWDVDPRRIGPGRLSSGGSLAAVVFVEYRAGAQVEMTPVPEFQALEMLLANAFDFGSVGVRGFEALGRIAKSVPCHHLVHGGQPEHLDLFESVLSRG